MTYDTILMSLVAQLVKNAPAMWETWVRSLGSIPGLGRSPGEGIRPLTARWFVSLEREGAAGAPGLSRASGLHPRLAWIHCPEQLSVARPENSISHRRLSAAPSESSEKGPPMDRGAWWAVVHGVARVGHD